MRIKLLTLSLFLMTLSACVETTDVTHNATTPASSALEEANMKMHHDMTVRPSGDADIDFVRGMIPHHQGAIDMAKIELQYGSDPAIKKLAKGIIAAQTTEIKMMQDWLTKNDK